VLGISNEGPGVEDILAGAVEPDQAIQDIKVLSLQLAMVGTPPAEPARLVSGPGVKKFLGWARARFHWVIVDSPPVVPAADVAQLAPLADATLLVVRAQCTSRDAIIKAVELLGDHLIGVVMNDASVESKPYYRYLAQYRESGASREKPGAAAPNVPSSCAENGRIASKVQ
jgi:Mrp family chromosome partitioning ATPase